MMTLIWETIEIKINVSDKNWKSLNMDRCYSPVCWERQNMDQFFKGCAGPGEWPEHIDGTKYPFGWNEVGFDDGKWSEVEAFGHVTEQDHSPEKPSPFPSLADRPLLAPLVHLNLLKFVINIFALYEHVIRKASFTFLRFSQCNS